MKRLSLTLTMLMVSSSHAGLTRFQPRWKDCKKAEECVILKGDCNQCEAVNLNYKKNADLYFRQQAMTIRCTGKKVKPLTNVVCFYNKCSCHR